jgi:hypothetical protein
MYKAILGLVLSFSVSLDNSLASAGKGAEDLSQPVVFNECQLARLPADLIKKVAFESGNSMSVRESCWALRMIVPTYRSSEFKSIYEAVLNVHMSGMKEFFLNGWLDLNALGLADDVISLDLYQIPQKHFIAWGLGHTDFIPFVERLNAKRVRKIQNLTVRWEIEYPQEKQRYYRGYDFWVPLCEYERVTWSALPLCAMEMLKSQGMNISRVRDSLNSRIDRLFEANEFTAQELRQLTLFSIYLPDKEKPNRTALGSLINPTGNNEEFARSPFFIEAPGVRSGLSKRLMIELAIFHQRIVADAQSARVLALSICQGNTAPYRTMLVLLGKIDGFLDFKRLSPLYRIIKLKLCLGPNLFGFNKRAAEEKAAILRGISHTRTHDMLRLLRKYIPEYLDTDYDPATGLLKDVEFHSDVFGQVFPQGYRKARRFDRPEVFQAFITSLYRTAVDLSSDQQCRLLYRLLAILRLEHLKQSTNLVNSMIEGFIGVKTICGALIPHEFDLFAEYVNNQHPDFNPLCHNVSGWKKMLADFHEMREAK